MQPRVSFSSAAANRDIPLLCPLLMEHHWVGKGSFGKDNLATRPGLINFQLCGSICKPKGVKEVHRGVVAAPMTLALLGLAVLPMGLANGFQPLQFSLLFQVHFLM